jgi:hypothetical protein
VSTPTGFDSFATEPEPKLRLALVARFGVEIGSQATVDASTYAWRRWDEVSGLGGPIGYLYRIGRNGAVRLIPRREAVVLCLRSGELKPRWPTGSASGRPQYRTTSRWPTRS